MFKKENNKEVLNSELYKKMMDDKINLIVELKSEREQLLNNIDAEYLELKNLRKQRKEIKNKLKIQKRALNKSNKERFKLTRLLNKEIKLANILNGIYCEEEEQCINVNKFYPKQLFKKRNI